MKTRAAHIVLICSLAVPLCFAPVERGHAQKAAKTGTTTKADVPAQKQKYEAVFATDGKGGLYFDDVLRTQKDYPGVKDYVIQGSLEPNFFYIVHYPQGLGEDADSAIKDFALRLAGESIFAYSEDTPKEDFFSSVHAKPAAIAAHEKALEAKLRKEGSTREEYESEKDKRIYPIFIDYSITETPAAVSVNFKTWGFAGGAHDNWEYSAISLDKTTGESLPLESLFSAPESLERTEHWLNTTKGVGYSCGGSCTDNQTSREPADINLASDESTEKGLRMNRIILTPQGLEVIFAPYEQGSFAAGDVRVPIPLEKFAGLGISDRYWRQRSPQ